MDKRDKNKRKTNQTQRVRERVRWQANDTNRREGVCVSVSLILLPLCVRPCVLPEFVHPLSKQASVYCVLVQGVKSGGAKRGSRLGGRGLSYRDGQGAPGWGLSGVGPVGVGRTALWRREKDKLVR